MSAIAGKRWTSASQWGEIVLEVAFLFHRVVGRSENPKGPKSDVMGIRLTDLSKSRGAVSTPSSDRLVIFRECVKKGAGFLGHPLLHLLILRLLLLCAPADFEAQSSLL